VSKGLDPAVRRPATIATLQAGGQNMANKVLADP
jgi:hypothetical protein